MNTLHPPHLRARRVRMPLLLCALIALPGIPAWAGPGKLVPSRTVGWPQWRGMRRDGISEEKGLLASWPADGPKLLWTATGIGNGFSSPVIANDTVYITGDADNDLHVLAFSLDGTLKWRAANGRSWRQPYPGARSSCTVDDGRVYHMNAHGRLACFDADSGAELWAVDILERFAAGNITWGLSESLLIDGDRVLATPAGKKGLMVALDKKTGATVWASEPLEGDTACYASPILIDFGARRLVVNCGGRNVFGVDPDTGKLLWSIPHPDTKNNVATTPVFWGDSVYITNASRDYGALFRVRIDAERGTAETVWLREMKFGHGGLACLDGKLYGANGGAGPRGWVQVDTETGEPVALGLDLGYGSVMSAGGALYCLAENGAIALVTPGAGGAAVKGRFTVQKAKDFWAHPVVWGGRLWLRCHDTLYCYDIRDAGK